MSELDNLLPGISRLDDVPGNSGVLAVHESLPYLQTLVDRRSSIILFVGATGCGKSKILPCKYYGMLCGVPRFRKKLLVLTTAAKDVENMHDHCDQPSHYRTGRNHSGGRPWKRADIVFSTIGMSSRWYASDGIYAFQEFDAVILDEIGALERNVEYSLMLEVMLEISLQHTR
jgi:hypothetical protein